MSGKIELDNKTGLVLIAIVGVLGYLLFSIGGGSQASVVYFDAESDDPFTPDVLQTQLGGLFAVIQQNHLTTEFPDEVLLGESVQLQTTVSLSQDYTNHCQAFLDKGGSVIGCNSLIHTAELEPGTHTITIFAGAFANPGVCRGVLKDSNWHEVGTPWTLQGDYDRNLNWFEYDDDLTTDARTEYLVSKTGTNANDDEYWIFSHKYYGQDYCFAHGTNLAWATHTFEVVPRDNGGGGISETLLIFVLVASMGFLVVIIILKKKGII